MIQSFETQLQVVLRALGEVVLPALDGAEGHVVEQLQLSMAALEFIRKRLPEAGRFYRLELADQIALATQVAELLEAEGETAETLRDNVQGAQLLLQRPAVDWSELIQSARALRENIAEIVARSGGKPHEAELDLLVATAASSSFLQSRLWCQPFGFETRPEDLPQPAWLQPAPPHGISVDNRHRRQSGVSS